MDKEIIKIEPRLTTPHRDDFLKFCYSLKRALNKRQLNERLDFLVQEKEELNKGYKGKVFHSNTDLVFIKNLLLDLMLQDWSLMIHRKNITLELLTLDKKDKNVNDEKAKTRRRHLLARDIQLKVPTVVEFVKNMEKKTANSEGLALYILIDARWVRT